MRCKGRPYSTLIGSVFLLLLLASCGNNYEYYDRDAKLGRDDYREALAAKAPPAEKPAPPIPDFAPMVGDVPTEPNQDRGKSVSLQMDGNTPLREVLTELAKQAGYDLELDPRIEGSLILTARDRPFEEVLERISDMAGLRYTLKRGVLRVEQDTAYHKTYRADFPNMRRSTSSTVDTSVGLSGSSAGGNATNESNANVTGTSDTDYWAEIISNLTQILGNTQRAQDVLLTNAPLSANSAQAAIAPPVSEGNQPASAAAPATPASAAASATASGTAPATAAGGTGTGGASAGQSSFTVNRQAGIVSVFATERQHRRVADYLNKLRQLVNAQVLIEAKIFEVQLNDEFRTGINWNSLFGGALELGVNTVPNLVVNQLNPLSNVSNQETGISMLVDNEDVQGLLNFVQGFGTLRTLSNPRVTALNNQSAILRVVNNVVYFRLTVTPGTTAEGGAVSPPTVTSSPEVVPIGVIVSAQPSIDLDTDTIKLYLRPTVSRVTGFANDPAVEFNLALSGSTTSANLESRIPVVAVQEMDTIINMNSGQVVVLGGLMQDSSTVDEAGVPGLQDIPVVGLAAKNRSDYSRKTELVMFIKATVQRDGHNSVTGEDRELYSRFGNDRRPWRLPE